MDDGGGWIGRRPESDPTVAVIGDSAFVSEVESAFDSQSPRLLVRRTPSECADDRAVLAEAQILVVQSGPHVSELIELRPRGRVVVVVEHEDDPVVIGADESRLPLTATIADLPGLIHPTDDSPASEDLSAREYQVLELMAEGLSTKEIAARLFISFHTVRNHIHRVLVKLDAHSKLQAVAVARGRGLLE